MADRMKKFLEMHNSVTGGNSGNNVALQNAAAPSPARNSTVGYKKQQKMDEFLNMHNQVKRTFSITGRDDGRDDVVTSFLRDSQGYIRETSGLLNRMNWADAMDPARADNRNKVWDNLRDRGSQVRSFMEENKGDIDPGKYQQIMSYLDDFNSDLDRVSKAYDDGKKYYSQWNSQEEYDGYLAYQKDLDEKRKLDLDAYEQEIKQLENAIGEYRNLSRWMQDDRGNARLDAIRQQYGGLEEMELELSRRRQYLTQAKREQEKVRQQKRFSDITQNPDFAARSSYDPSNSEIGYRYINADTAGRLDLEEQYGDYVRQFGSHAWDSLDEEDKQIYNYLMNTGDRQGAAEYLRHLEETLQYRKGEEVDAAMDTLVKEDPKAKALRYAFMANVGYNQHLSGMQGMGNLIAGKEDYVPPSSTQVAGQLVREDLREDGRKLPEQLGGGSTGQMVGDLISTTANMVPSILASRVAGMVGGPVASKVATGLMMGGSAGGSAYQEMINEGYSKEQARLYGLSIGAAEGTLEAILGGISSLGGGGIAKVTHWTENLDNALLNFALRLGGAGGSEALEEGLQEMISGWIKSEITHEYFWAKPADVLYSSLMGFLSGGMFEGPGIITDIGQQIAEGRNVLDSKGVAPLKEIAQASTDQTVRKTAGKITDSSSAFAVGNLARKAQSEVAKQNSADLAKSLSQKGMPEKAARQYGDMLSYMLEAGSDTEIQRTVMESDPVVGQVLREAQMPGSMVHQRLQNMSAASGKTISIDRVASLYGKQAAAVKQIYNQGQKADGTKQDVETFAYGFQRAFTVGRENGNVSAITEEVAPGLTQSQRELAYDLGRDAVAAEKAAISKRTTGTAAAVHILNEDGSVGDEVRIAEISSRDGDSVTYVLEDGRTVSEDQLSFSGDNAVLDTVKDLGLDVQTSNVVIRGNKTIMRADTLVAHGIDDAYRYGSHGYSLERLAKDSPFAALLTEEMRTAVYNAGKNAPATSQKNPPAVKVKTRGKTAGIYYDAGGGDVKAYRPKQFGKLEHKRESGVYAAQVLQKLGIGVDFYFFKSYVNKKGERVYLDENGMEQKAPNGWYDKSDSSIHIDLNAGNDGQGLTLFTMAHELTHFIEQWSQEKYKVLADFLIQNYEKGQSMDELVLIKQQALSAGRKKPVSYEEAYSEVIADSMEAMLADGNVMDKLQELKAKDSDLVARMKEFFDRMVKRITKYYQGLQPESEEGQLVLEMKDQFKQIQQLFAEALADASENFQAAAGIGLEVDMDTESVSPAVLYSERTWRESDYVQERNKAAQEISKAIGVSVKKARQYIDSVNSIAKMIAEDRTRLDYFSSPGRSSFIGNVEYGGSFDFSTLCKKRRLLTGTFTAIQKALPNTALTANEILDIRNRMKDAGLEVSCGLCYVEGSRANMGQFAKEFLRLYKQYYPDAWQPNMADVNTPDGIEWVRINHPECYEQYEYFWNHYGTLKAGDKNLFASQQKPKLYQLHTEYKGEILQKFKGDDNVEEKNLNGGIRLQSFSDFEIVHLIGTMQIIMDMSRVGLAGQAYTKVPDFAWALGDTGLKINLSLIAKGVDESGNLIFDDIEGMPITEAMRLRERYSANVGTILVAFNDAQLMAAMKDNRVDFIIPFHRSQWKKSQYEAMGLPAKTKDYTFMQNEKFIKPQYHEYRGRMVKDKATNYMPNEYWDFSKTGKENAEAYLQMCARNNKRPKFYKLLQNNGDGSYSLKADGSTDGYWKLLIDFKMYDNDGNGSPQMPVRPDFNMEEATRMLDDYKGGHSNFPVAQGIVDSFVSEYKENHGDRMYSDRKKASGYDYSKTFLQQLLDFDSNLFPERDTFVLGGTPDVLRRIGLANLPMTINQRHVSDSLYGTYKGTQQEKQDHTFTLQELSTLPEKIADPIAIIHDKRAGKAASQSNVDVLVEMTAASGKQVIAAVQIGGNGHINGLRIDANKVATVHGNKDSIARLIDAINANEAGEVAVFFVNKEKTTKVLKSAGNPIPRGLSNLDGYIHSINDPGSPVNIRITKQTETKQFREWFEGSKVINPDGSPKEMYHGTSNGGFTVFNTYGGNFGLFGKGSYFTDNPEVADSYTRKGKGQEPEVYGVYLSIKNPLDMDAHADLNAWKKAFENADLDPSYLDGVVTNEDAFRQLKENLADEEYLRWEAEDLVTELIEGMGYDGITHIGGGRYGSKDGPKHRVYIAFEPEQIKSSTDNIGTFDGSNPDIRYQDRSAGTSNRALLAGAFEDLARSPAEMEFLQKYQENIGLLNEQEAKLQEIRTEIRELTFGKGPKDPKRLEQLQEEAGKTANRIHIYDKKLMQLEAAKPLRDVLDREREKVRKATRQKGQEALAEYREKRKESAAKKDARRKIRKTVMELDKLLNRGDKKKNVKASMTSMVDSVLKLADALFMDEYTNRDMLRNGVGVELTDAEEKLFQEAQQILQKAESGAAIEGMEFTSEVDAMNQLKKLDQKLSSKMAGLKDVFARERKRLYGTTVSDLLGKLADEYSRLSEAEDGAVRAAKDENVYAHLLQLQKDVGGTTVRDMTLNQMEAVADAFTMVLTTVRNANKMFAKNLRFKRDTLAGMVMGEIGAAVKKINKLIRPGKNAVDTFTWNNLKPVYAFERLGSETLKTLYQNIRSGQDVWSRDMQEADDFRREQYRKHNRKAWDLEKQHRFEFESGIVELSLEQIMSLYAYSRREQALDHLLKGGFVFSGSTEVMVKEHGIQHRYLKKDATAYNLTADELLQVVDTLTKDQKAFVEEMQTYLSDVMGGKGNEISLQMYGIKSYGEKNYFPIRSAGQYMERAKEDSFRKEQGQISIVNSGFTKSTTPKANNPITLDSFMNVWAEHVNEMSMYHGFALPMEDFRRVYNYSSPNMEVGNSQSVNAVIENAFGKAATGYIDQLYKDLNGGALTDNREGLSKKLVGLHKKAAVFASASVVVQQPSAIVRAFALIDPRHFIGPKVDRKRHKQLWEEVKKYAPVAFVKEMGYFDTGMGRSARDFLQAEEYSGIREKMAALFKDTDYRDEILGKAPALADELTWCSIWEAVKRETKVKNPTMDVRSDAFLQIAGARFSEVIDKTQVYDSVLSRSANMRSKSGLMNMVTSFLAEPTTSINMLEDALRKGDRKQLKRTVGAVYGSVLLNSLLVSLVYAARDDDEDETYLEKYLSSVAVEMMDGINPITYYPILRDIWSIGQGFDVERADMTLISDFADAAKKVIASGMKLRDAAAEEKASALAEFKDSLWSMTDTVASLTGLPVKNIRRDIEGARNMVRTIQADLNTRDTTKLSLMDAVLGDVMNSIPIGGLLYNKSKRDRLYGAIVAKDSTYVNRLKASYETDAAYHSALKLALRDHDSRIWEAAMAWNNNDLKGYMALAREIIAEGNFIQDDVVLAIRAEASSMEEKQSASSSTIKGYFTNEKFGVAMGQNNTSMADIIREDLIDTKIANGKTREEAEESVKSTARSQLRELFETGAITASSAEKMLVKYGGYETDDAADKVAEWEYEVDHPELNGRITFSQYQLWETDGKNRGIALETYTNVVEYRGGNTSSGVRSQEDVAGYINSMPISTAQKDALWCCFWSESTLYKNAPWRK